jgi:diaminopimelate epimerase
VIYESEGSEVRMRLFNADGSRAEVSGNGVRALGAVLLHDDHRPDVTLTINTEAGPRELRRLGRHETRQMFRTAMGLPTGLRGPVAIEAAGETIHAIVLNMGNPQCVVLGPLPDKARFERLGSAMEWHALFPDGTNVEFAEVEAPDRVRILIWERGVGRTSSSGTGSCAALVAAASFGGASREADIVAPGGSQRVEWLSDSVHLTGWAEVVCSGEWIRPLPAWEVHG